MVLIKSTKRWGLDLVSYVLDANTLATNRSCWHLLAPLPGVHGIALPHWSSSRESTDRV